MIHLSLYKIYPWVWVMWLCQECVHKGQSSNMCCWFSVNSATLYVWMGFQGRRLRQVVSGLFVWKDPESGCLLCKACCLCSENIPSRGAGGWSVLRDGSLDPCGADTEHPASWMLAAAKPQPRWPGITGVLKASMPHTDSPSPCQVTCVAFYTVLY